MRFGFRLSAWAVLAIPALTGFPLGWFSHEIVTGADAAWIGYGLICQGVICRMVGIRRWRWILTLAVWITLPVVFGGAVISAVFHPLSWHDAERMARQGSHYLRLCITMLTVVPMATGLVAIVPFGSLERRIFADPAGISPRQVRMLMFLRVFTHILYQVIPTVLEGLREEGIFSRRQNPCSARDRIRRAWQWIGYLRHVCVECVCSSLLYIPLWAAELSELAKSPESGESGPEPRNATHGPE